MGHEIDRTQAVMITLVGAPPRLLRPPYGRRDFRVYRAPPRAHPSDVVLRLARLLERDAATLTRRLARVGRGDIVLLHDGLPRRAAMLGALGTLLARLSTEKIPFSTLDPAGPPEAQHPGAAGRDRA